MEVVALIRHVFLHLIAKMSDQLEQQINFKFCVQLGKNAGDICAVLSNVYGREAMKKSSIFEWHKQFRESLHVEITNEDNGPNFLQYHGYCSL
jgi:hypothetical protein